DVCSSDLGQAFPVESSVVNGLFDTELFKNILFHLTCTGNHFTFFEVNDMVAQLWHVHSFYFIRNDSKALEDGIHNGFEIEEISGNAFLFPVVTGELPRYEYAQLFFFTIIPCTMRLV